MLPLVQEVRFWDMHVLAFFFDPSVDGEIEVGADDGQGVIWIII